MLCIFFNSVNHVDVAHQQAKEIDELQSWDSCILAYGRGGQICKIV